MTDTNPKLEIDGINRIDEIAVLSDDRIVPVTNWFDEYGEECDPEDAVACVAGKNGIGWFSVNLYMFGGTYLH